QRDDRSKYKAQQLADGEAQRLADRQLLLPGDMHGCDPRDRPAENAPHDQEQQQEDEEEDPVLAQQPAGPDRQEVPDPADDTAVAQPIPPKHAVNDAFDLLDLVEEKVLEEAQVLDLLGL